MVVSKANCSKTICPMCSLQDGLILRWRRPSARFTDDNCVAVDYDAENPINEGSLCPRGNSVAELVDHPQRLESPRVRGRSTDWDTALRQVAADLQAVIKKHGPESVGILAGGALTLEEAGGLGKLAREILGTPHVAPLFPEDGPVFSRLAHLGWDAGFTLREVQERQVTLLVGDVFSEHPVISKRILRAKYKDRSHRLFVIDSLPTQTSWFGHERIRPAPGTEALVLVGIVQLLSQETKSPADVFSPPWDLGAVEKRTGVARRQMETVARAMSSARDGLIVQSNLFGRQGRSGSCALLGHILARLAAGKWNFLHLPVSWNSRGVYQMLSGGDAKDPTGPRILEMVSEGHIQGLMLFGLDPLSAVPSKRVERALGKLKFLCLADCLPTQTTPLAHVILPTAVGPEKSGQVLYLNGDRHQLQTAIPAPGLARAEMDIIADLAGRLGGQAKLSMAPGEVEAKLKGAGQGTWKELLTSETDSLSEFLSAQGKGQKAYPLYLVPTAVPAHLGDGAITRHFSWAQKICGQPCIWASRSLMKEFNLQEGDQVQISSAADRGIFPLALDADLPADVLAAPIHFPQVRRLFSWRLEGSTGELLLEPEPVTLSLPKERS